MDIVIKWVEHNFVLILEFFTSLYFLS
jgi:hypothetical protein